MNKKQFASVDATTLNCLVDAMGAVVRAMVATLPAAQQKVFLTRMMDASDSAEAAGDIKLDELIQTLIAVGQSEQRPESGGAT